MSTRPSTSVRAGTATSPRFRILDISSVSEVGVMNLLAPLLRLLFAGHHNWVMAQGERGLTR
jgi:hypothetical protein